MLTGSPANLCSICHLRVERVSNFSSKMSSPEHVSLPSLMVVSDGKQGGRVVVSAVVGGKVVHLFLPPLPPGFLVGGPLFPFPLPLPPFPLPDCQFLLPEGFLRCPPRYRSSDSSSLSLLSFSALPPKKSTLKKYS